MDKTLDWKHPAIQSASHWLTNKLIRIILMNGGWYVPNNFDRDSDNINIMNVRYDILFGREFNCVIHSCKKDKAGGFFSYFNHVEFNTEQDLTMFLLKWSES